MMRRLLFILMLVATGFVQGHSQSLYYSRIEPLERIGCFAPLFEPQLRGDTVDACKGNPFDYQLLVSNAVSCNWSVSGGTIEGYRNNGTTVTVRWSDTDYGSLEVRALDSTGDTCYAALRIVLADGPVAGCQSTPNYVIDEHGKKIVYVCEKTPVYFVDNSDPNGSERLSSYWKSDNGFSTQNTFVFNPNGSGVYQIIHRVTNECGCYDEEEITVKVQDDCPIKMSCYGTVCANSPASYTLLSPNCHDYRWIVEGGRIMSQSGNQVDVLWGNPESGYGMLTLDGSTCDCPCPFNKSIRIPIISDGVNITGPDTVCLNSRHVFSVPLWAATRYDWSITGNSQGYDFGTQGSSTNEVAIQFNQSGTYVLHVDYECSILGCGPYSATKIVYVCDSIHIQSNQGSTICIGDTVVFTCNAGQEEDVLWRLIRNEDEVAQCTRDTFAYVFQREGYYSIELHGSQHCNIDRYQQIVRPRPGRPSIGNQYACPESVIFLKDDSVPSNCYVEWRAVNQEYTTPVQATGDEVSFEFGDEIGDFEVVHVDMQYGCRSLPGIVRVSRPRLSSSGLSGVIYLCKGQTAELSVPDQRDQGVLYHWAADSSHHVTVVGSELNPSVTIMATYNERDEGPYSRYLTLKRSYCGITEEETVEVRIGEAFTPTIMPHDTLVCPGDSVVLTVDAATAL